MARMSRLDHQATSAAESLISAIRSFDVDTVEKLLKSDLEIEYRNRDHHSVLHIAIKLIETGGKFWERASFIEESNKRLNPLYRPEAHRRIFEQLLESGIFDVDALTSSCKTVLHLAIECCLCKQFSGDAYEDLVNAIIKLLLKNNANINAKTSNGETPLMKASEHGCIHIVKLLLNWRDEFGAGVDLNARDIYGETALIKAAKWTCVDVIELLLQHGCLDEFQGYRGFDGLHAVINGSISLSNASRDFLALIGVLASEETSKVLKRYAAHSSIGDMICKRWPGNDSIQETVSMLVTRGRADINSLDFRGNTVLDVALESKLRINQKTIEKLREYGATSSALLNKHPDYSKIAFQYTNKLGKTPLHRLSAVLPELTLREKVEIFMHHLNSSHHKEAFEEITVAKDHRGRTVLHYAVMPSSRSRSLSSDDIILLINVLKLKGTINKRDNYGRIPLHYCEGEPVYKSLAEQGANEHISDIDGNTPQDLKKLRNEELIRYHLPRKLENKVNEEKIDAWMIWKNSEYACRDPFSNTLCDKVQKLMNNLSDEIRKKDPRFECRPVLIGSAEEGTKIGLPDEFDFNFVLTKLGELCEVVPSPEAPSGFVHLKRRYNNAEFRPENQHIRNQEKFDKFFNSGGFILTTEIACRFRILYLQVMSEPEFWEGEEFFEWNPHNEGGKICASRDRQYEGSEIYTDFMPSIHPCSTIQLKLNRPIEGRYIFTLISVDVVPCIQLNGWWPEEALSSLSDQIKLEGCHLVFDQPQRKYPWVPFSDPFARISFAPAESRLIKDSSAVARAAYMVGKQLLFYYEHPKLTYVLKTCLLYCIEALKNCTNYSLLYKDINPTELTFFVEKLMLCFHEFYLQDFLPCYMMPSFHLPIEQYLKSKHNDLLNDASFEYPLFAYELYSKVCTTESPVDFCLPTPESLSEKFNKEELLRQLSMDRSYIEHRSLQRKSLATGQMVRSDSQSESSKKTTDECKQEVKVKKPDLT